MSDNPQTGGAGTGPQPGAAGNQSWPPHDHGSYHSRRGGIWTGVILILIGAAVLLGQFTTFVDVLKLWPLFIIAGGLVSIFRPRGEPWTKHVVQSLGTIAVGLVLLGNTFGYLSWAVWFSVFSLWPVLLVALGIELLGKGLGMTWLRVVSSLLILVAFLYAVLVMTPGGARPGFLFPITSGRPTAPFGRTVPHDASAIEGDALVKVGAARLSLAAGSDLAGLSGTAVSGTAPTLQTSVASGTASVSVTDPQTGAQLLLPGDRRVDVTLDSAVVWRSVSLELGAVDAAVDLSRIDARAITLSTGASDIRLTVGDRAKDVAVQVKGGVASVVVRLPASAAVTVDAKSGLSNVSAPPAFRRVSGVPGLGESRLVADGTGGPRITLTMESGVSDLTIETY